MRVDIQRLLQIAEDIDDNVDGLEEEMSDIADEIEDMDDEIEDFGEGIEGMETGVQAVATEMEGLREEVKTMRSVFGTGLEVIREKVESETDWLGDRVKNWTQFLRDDTQDIKEEAKKVSEEMRQLRYSIQALKNDTKIKALEEQLQTVLANTTGNQLVVKEELADLRNNLLNKMEGLEQSTLILANHTETELRDVKEELTNITEHVGRKVDSLESELREVTENHLEVREELAGLQRDMNSTLYLLQEVRSQLVNLRQENSADHQNILAGSCSELELNSRSGYYWLRGMSEQVYCDMDRQSCGCGSIPGWMRVADIDMTDPNQQCPEGFRLRSGTSKRMCETTIVGRGYGCTSIVFPTHSVQYSRVCGRAQAYQYGSVVAFKSFKDNRQTTIDGIYVDGVSVTHGQSPRNHIWTFAAALDEIRSDSGVCPCIRNYTGPVPPFIGNDYFCDTGSRQGWQYRLYTEDPLWDGEGCGPPSSCCQFNSPPWFCKELPQPTTDDIEVRMCRYFYFGHNAYTPFDIIQLYVQ